MFLFEIAFLLAIFFCALTTGLVYTFAIVVMPGIRMLPDRDFLLAFRVMDLVIQKNDPRFLVVWAGSVLALILACVFGFGELEGANWQLLVATTLVYLLGVQAPTIAINVPLNNRLQALGIDDLNPVELQVEREAFEGRWNYWNAIRTVIACICTLMLLLLAIRL